MWTLLAQSVEHKKQPCTSCKSRQARACCPCTAADVLMFMDRNIVSIRTPHIYQNKKKIRCSKD